MTRLRKSIPPKLFSLVVKHFNGNEVQARLWFEIPNPDLRGFKPKDYRIGGKWDRLEKLILQAINGETNEHT